MTTPAAVLREDVDGVPAFWTDSDTDTLTATLSFRYGAVDLPLIRHGWLHLLEHMALHGQHSVRAPVNGHVALQHTAFHVRGEPSDVIAFLERLCGWLAAPRLDDLDHEVRVLRAEAGQRAKGALSRHLLWRYGARGPGLVGYDELGLHRVDPGALIGLARHVYTRGNAVLALSGRLPAGIRLSLPAGERILLPQAVPCEQPYPAGFTAPDAGVSVSGTVPRSVAAAAFARLFERALHKQFRDRDGVGYSGWSGYEPVDGDTAVITAGIDVLPEARDRIVDRVYTLMWRLADGQIGYGDVVDDAGSVAREMRAARPGAEAFAMARAELLGGPVQTFSDLIAEVEAVSISDVAEAAGSVRNSMLLCVDAGVNRGTSLKWLDSPPVGHIDPPHDARQFRPVDYPVTKSRLSVSDRQALLVSGQTAVAVRRDDVAAALVWPDGARSIIRTDGYKLNLEPTLWRNGHEAVTMLDRLTGAELQVRLPARDPADVPQPRTTRRQRFAVRHPRLRAVPYLVAVVLLTAVVGLLLTALRMPPRLVSIGAIAAFVGTSRMARRRIGRPMPASRRRR